VAFYVVSRPHVRWRPYRPRPGLRLSVPAFYAKLSCSARTTTEFAQRPVLSIPKPEALLLYLGDTLGVIMSRSGLGLPARWRGAWRLEAARHPRGCDDAGGLHGEPLALCGREVRDELRDLP
jgi:hypothetical protein